MAIGNVVQRGNSVIIYDVRGHQIGIVSAGSGRPPDGLVGYTGATVNVRRGSAIITYDERGRQTGVVSAR
jgi:hypothetical protein